MCTFPLKHEAGRLGPRSQSQLPHEGGCVFGEVTSLLPKFRFLNRKMKTTTSTSYTLFLRVKLAVVQKPWHIVGPRLASPPLAWCCSVNYAECIIRARGSYHHLVYRSQHCISSSRGGNTSPTPDTRKPKFKNDG